MVRHVWPTDGAEEDCIVVRNPAQAIVREQVPGSQVALATPVELVPLERDVVPIADVLQQFDARGTTSGAMPSPGMTANL